LGSKKERKKKRRERWSSLPGSPEEVGVWGEKRKARKSSYGTVFFPSDSNDFQRGGKEGGAF